MSKESSRCPGGAVRFLHRTQNSHTSSAYGDLPGTVLPVFWICHVLPLWGRGVNSASRCHRPCCLVLFGGNNLEFHQEAPANEVRMLEHPYSASQGSEMVRLCDYSSVTFDFRQEISDWDTRYPVIVITEMIIPVTLFEISIAIFILRRCHKMD